MPEISKKDMKWFLKAIVKSLFGFVLVLVFIFILAGRITYWQGWLFTAVMILTIAISLPLFSDKIDLGKERLKPGPGTKWWDKIFYALYIPSNLATIVVAVLDTGRFGWSQVSFYGYAIGYLSLFAGIFISQWAKYANRWFSSTVRIQKDRNQKVVQSGPYKFVRHPGYVGGIFLAVGMSLVFGSLWGLVPAGITVVLLVIRTCLEDRMLQRELDGYREYSKKTKYRLVPGVW